MQRLAASLQPDVKEDGRVHPAKAGKTRTTKIDRHREQRHLARRRNGGKGGTIEIQKDRTGNGDIIGDQQINLVRRKTAVGEIAANTDGDLAENFAVGLRLPALNPDNIFCSCAMLGCLAGRWSG